MKIGIDARLIAKSGVGRYIRSLLDNLLVIDQKNEYLLFLLAENIKHYKNKYQKARCEILPVAWHGWQNQILTPKIISQYQLDLMHFPYFDAPIFYSGKFIVTIHDLIIDHHPTGRASTKNIFTYHLKRLGYQFVMQKAVDKALKIIVPSNSTKEELVSHYQVSSDKIFVIYEGIKTPGKNVAAKILDKLNLKPRQYFLYVGNAYPHKNLEYLLSSFEALLLKKPDLRERLKLVLVGENDFFYQRLKKLVIVKKLNEQILITGFVSDDDLKTLYKNTLSFIFPSKMEGFGLPILEALANDSPVIASDIPIFHEIAEGSVFYFDLNIKEALTDLLFRIVENKLKTGEKIEIGRKIIKKYSLEKMAKQTLKLYESCVGL